MRRVRAGPDTAGKVVYDLRFDVGGSALVIVIVHTDSTGADELVDELVDYGLDARTPDTVLDAAVPIVPDVVVVCLDPDAELALSTAATVLARPDHADASVLFTGGEEDGLKLARRRYPKASFTRRDALPTALASLNG